MIPAIKELFDLDQTEHAELFDGVKYPWEVLPLLASYIAHRTSEPLIEGEVSQGAVVGDQVVIGAGTIVEPGAVIHGPAIIGKNCVIRSGAYIRENVIIGDGCTVGHAAEIKNSLLFNEAQLPHFNYVGDSILGYRAHLGGGAALSNVKNTGTQISIQTNEGSISTGLEKCGSFLGDESQMGCNAVINPGSIIGRRSIIYPLVSFRGMLPADSIVKLRQELEFVTKRSE